MRVELQADCLAGVVGDDRIQAQTSGRISPETFTHGTAEQRASWFKRGFDDGDATACDTFSGDIWLVTSQ